MYQRNCISSGINKQVLYQSRVPSKRQLSIPRNDSSFFVFTVRAESLWYRYFLHGAGLIENHIYLVSLENSCLMTHAAETFGHFYGNFILALWALYHCYNFCRSNIIFIKMDQIDTSKLRISPII